MSLPVETRRQWIKSRREQRKLTKYARLRRQFLRYSILSILLIGGLVGFARIYWYLSENKHAQGIEIVGNFVAGDEQIRRVLKQEIIHTPLFALNPEALENRIKTLSIVKQAFVRRYALPYPKLKVEVLEEFPWATLYSAASPSSVGSTRVSTLPLRTSRLRTPPSASLYADSTYLSAASPDGEEFIPQFVVAESGRLISIREFPHVFQPALKIYCDNSAQCHFNANKVEIWANWISYISKEMQCSVLAIDMRQPHDVKVETNKFKLVLGNPDTGLTHRLYRLSSVLGVLASQHKEPVYVNLGLNSNIPVKLAKKLDRPGTEEKTSRL